MKTKVILLLVFFGWNTHLCSQAENAYRIVYEADEDGKAISGDIDKLMAHVQNGNPLRVGWVLNFQHPKTKENIEMQHWTDAGFITTLNGHIFAQIRGIFEQGPNLDKPPSVFLTNDRPDTWVAIIGTTGMMRQKFDSKKMEDFLKADGLTDDEIKQFLKERESRKVQTKWSVAVQ